MCLAVADPTFAQAPMPMPGHAGMQRGAAPMAHAGATPGMAADQQEMMTATEWMNRDMDGGPHDRRP